MSTRLDRLFLLLETGSTPVIRKSAAEQLGDVQKLHPHELNNLLAKVHVYLCSATWETRIAAGQAVDAIAKNVPQWNPKPALKDAESPHTTSGHLQLAKFDVQKVLSHGASLLASEGIEFEEEELTLDDKDKLTQQRQQLNKRLGLDGAGGLGVDANDLFMEEDLVLKRDVEDSLDQQSSVKDLLKEQLPGGTAELSARERNRAKRKAKLLAKQTSRECEQKNGDSEGESAPKLRKTSSVVVEQPNDDKILLDNVPGNTLNMDELDEWPFEVFCEMLMNDLFHSSWEKRHGAATGLREVIKTHGAGAGLITDCSAAQLLAMHQRYLEDLAVRLICVLALDRFGDYISDEVVAPVRESCAQTLGMTLQHMSSRGVQQVVMVIMQLLDQHHWEVRHGGLLGLKYVLAVRQDLTASQLPMILPAVFSGIQDRDDDVRAVAAAALLPVADILVTSQAAQIPQIIECLWYTLLDLDDLTASTNSIMSLLSTLLAHPHVSSDIACSQSLTVLVPRLWPFLRHGIRSVRKAAMDTISTLLTRFTTDPGATWLLPILQEGLRHLYQGALMENSTELLNILPKVWSSMVLIVPTDHLVSAASPWVGVWMSLMMQPMSIPFDSTLLIEPQCTPKELTPSRARHTPETESGEAKDKRCYIGGSEAVRSKPTVMDLMVVRARQTAARLLGILCSALTCPLPASVMVDGLEAPVVALNNLFMFHLNSKSANQRFSAGLVLAEWAKQTKSCLCADEVKVQLHRCLMEPIYFDEIAMSFTKVQTSSRHFITGLKQQGIDMDTIIPPGTILTLEQAHSLCTSSFDSVAGRLMAPVYKLLNERRTQLLAMVEGTINEQQQLTNRVQASLAGAAIWLGSLPEKMSPVVRPIMDILKKESNQQLQLLAAECVPRLCELCVGRTPSPIPKIIKNLVTMLCCDPCFTPVLGQEGKQFTSLDLPAEATCDKYSGILTLYTQQVTLETGRGRRANVLKKAPSLTADVSLESVLNEEDEGKKQQLIQRQGATLALRTIVHESGSSLVEKVPNLWDIMTDNLQKIEEPDEQLKNDVEEDNGRNLIQSLQVLEICVQAMDTSMHPQLVMKLPLLCRCLEHRFTAVRHMAARCLGMLSRAVTTETMNHVLDNVLVMLGGNERCRHGAIEGVSNIIQQLSMDVVPYIVLLVVPIMGCMSDQSPCVRLMATSCFATLVRLLPLESGIPDPPAMKTSLIAKKEQEREFLEQLLDGSKVKNYKISVPIDAELRKYQQDGVNWLAFLNKYKLHGILCDDMGLGKTLQSLCILAGDHQIRADKYQETHQADCGPQPSIVVCPPTLTGHWVYEVEKFVKKEHLNPLHYHGPPNERLKLQKRFKSHNLVVASYDVVRNDIDFFGKIRWNYCILDEGHIIKNSKTKISRAVKQLSCNHRLILSGTPIQNNVLELWSLFDFLMPGFLGTEKQFQARYGRPILQSRDAKSSTKEQEAGALAMESLHRQVLPFLLRRLKEDVLKDLPPKIIQDYYCDLSPLQIKLYEDFAKSRAKRSLDDTVHGAEKKDKRVTSSETSHIFQALQYLRKVCNHPSLVLTRQHPEYSTIIAKLHQEKSSLRDLEHAPKLVALKQLLIDCGIGVSGSDSSEAPVVNQHRVLLFCQLKSMLDIVEKDVLKTHMPSVTYLRMDGSVAPGNRHSIVNRFNNDPSIDILLLTTHVGGLGLNLTGADTVIFVEHDWNPMKDLQAMDRAHRIGQKKVVNVYRLVTRCTLEEKIMGLQKFKMKIANSIITQDNSSLSSMGTDQLLDLFSLDHNKKQQPVDSKSDQSNSSSPQKPTMKSILDNLEDIWDENQYDSEYNLETFMKSLHK